MGAHMRWQGSYLRMVVSSESLTSLVRWQEKFILPDYMEKQPDISGDMRAILVDWMVEVQVCGHGHGLLQHSPHPGLSLWNPSVLAEAPAAVPSAELVLLRPRLGMCPYPFL